MRRVIFIILGLFASLALAVVALVVLLPMDQYKGMIEKQASDALQRPVKLVGPLSLSVFPRPGVTAQNIRIGNAVGAVDPDFASIQSVSAYFEILPLLKRQIRVSRIALHHPSVFLEKMTKGGDNWSSLIAALSTPRPASFFDVNIQEVSFEHWDIQYRNAEQVYKLQDASAQLALSSMKGPFSLSGKASLFEVPVQFSVRVASMSSPIETQVTLSSGEAKVAFTGAINSSPMQLSGKVDLKVSKDLFARFYAPGWPQYLGDTIALAGELKANADTVRLDQGKLELSGNSIDLTLQTGLAAPWPLSMDLKEMPGQSQMSLTTELSHWQAGHFSGSSQSMLALLKWLQIDASSLPAHVPAVTWSFDYGLVGSKSLRNMVLTLGGAQILGSAEWLKDGSGRFNLTAPRIETLLGQFALSAPITGQVSVASNFSYQNKKLKMSSLQMNLGSLFVASGQLSVDGSSSKPSVVVDLGTSPIALESLMGQSLPTNTDAHWSQKPISLKWLEKFNGNFHIRSSKITYKAYVLTSPKLDATLQSGTLNIDSMSAQMLGGSMSLNGKITSQNLAQVSYNLSGVNLHNLPSDSKAFKLLTGELQSKGQLTAAASSTLGLMSTLSGQVSFDCQNGVIKGIDLDAISERLSNMNNLASALSLLQSGLSGGNTAFKTFNGAIVFDKGRGTIRNMTLVAKSARASVQGSVDLPNWTMDVATEVAWTQNPDLPSVGMKLTGSIDDPKREMDLSPMRNYLIQNVFTGIGNILKGQQDPNTEKKNPLQNLMDVLLPTKKN